MATRASSSLLVLLCLGVLSYAVKIDVAQHEGGHDVLLDAISSLAPTTYRIGRGIYDVTGPTAEEGMMGYAMPQQRAEGLHLRLWARAYIFVDSAGTRLAFVSSDLCMTMQSVKLGVIERLQVLYPGLYTMENVMLTGTHTHSGPGGFSWYALYDITTLGFSEKNYEAIVSGIVQAIVRAHNDLGDGVLSLSRDWLDDSNINRSPYAYLFNPPQERAKYAWDTDKNITVLRLDRATGEELGAITWFAVHCTSMNNTNKLISSDNKGYAAYLFEKAKNGNRTIMGQGNFVAAFAQSNEGDVSPNTKGPHCPNGQACDFATSTCNGKTEECISPGPGDNMYESTQIIGTNQFKKAVSLFDNKAGAVPLQGPIHFIHTWVNMTNITVDAKFVPTNKTGQTCQAAYGYSFAAGTTDGPGAFDFTQHDNKTSGNVFWDFISSFIADPTPQQKACQAPKPILLDVGLTKPIPWVPDVVPLQIATIGQLILIAVPGEFTTMSGRRLRDTVKNTLIANGFPSSPEPVPIIVGLANTYTGYIATYEEYHVQRYEGASTIFGPHTLSAYQQEFSKLAVALANGKTVPPGPSPRNLTGQTFSFQADVIADMHPLGKPFGTVLSQPAKSYTRGQVVQVVFQGANPRNDYLTMSSFLTVQIQEGSQWSTILTDADWDTKMHWKRVEEFESQITIDWDISLDAQPGTYRITHQGHYKENPLFETVLPYSGTSDAFTVA